MSASKDLMYLAIARACLNALNESSKTSPEEAYQKVYEAIDAAFNTLFENMVSWEHSARTTLEKIASLPPEQSEEAIQLAREALQNSVH
ncbi:MAG TPA: hypothetical protein VFM46_18290 [Pseudomonadales bacterium]|nr:hypothetical protein [Pseudomonadales bacterium]